MPPSTTVPLTQVHWKTHWVALTVVVGAVLCGVTSVYCFELLWRLSIWRKPLGNFEQPLSITPQAKVLCVYCSLGTGEGQLTTPSSLPWSCYDLSEKYRCVELRVMGTLHALWLRPYPDFPWEMATRPGEEPKKASSSVAPAQGGITCFLLQETERPGCGPQEPPDTPLWPPDPRG